MKEPRDMTREERVDWFLPSVDNHAMTVLLDAASAGGRHRHLRFADPKSRILWFELVFWPERAVVSGDCGTYVFKRDNIWGLFTAPLAKIDFDYVSQKCAAADRDFPVLEFSIQRLESHLSWRFDAVRESGNVSDSKLAGLWEAIEATFLCGWEHDVDEKFREAAALEMLQDFEYDGVRLDDVDDFQPRDVLDYSSRFIWCCMAACWGVAMFNKSSGDTHGQ